jgi:hypothetical protein
MRRAFYGVVLALALGGVANASDFIVVNSTDPSIQRGQAFDAGARVPLAAGKTLKLMRSTGEVTTVLGGAAGVVLPGEKVPASDASRFDTLRALLEPPPAGRTFGARRGGFCPPADTLVSMDDIVRVAQTSCKTEARAALEAYLAKAGKN